MHAKGMAMGTYNIVTVTIHDPPTSIHEKERKCNAIHSFFAWIKLSTEKMKCVHIQLWRSQDSEGSIYILHLMLIKLFQSPNSRLTDLTRVLLPQIFYFSVLGFETDGLLNTSYVLVGLRIVNNEKVMKAELYLSFEC